MDDHPVRSQLRSWLASAEFQKILEAALEQRRMIGALFSMTFDADPLIRWRAIDAIGRCAGRLATLRPESMKNFIRRLFWMMNDESGSVAWHAPEAIGEIVRSDPREFGSFIPMTISLLDMEPEDRPSFMPGILHALGRIGEVAPHSMDAYLPQIENALTDRDVQTRAMAVLCLARLSEKNRLLQYGDLLHDAGRALVYRDEQLVETAISNLLCNVLDGSKCHPEVF